MIIFDLDDTLIDTSGSITPIKLERTLCTLCAEGLVIENFSKSLQELLAIHAKSNSSKEALKKFLEEIDAIKFLSLGLKEIYSSSLDGIEVKPLEYVNNCLNHLVEKHVLALVSIGERELQLEKLKKSEIDLHLFSKITITSQNDKEPFYKKLLSEFKIKPKSVIVCGDRINLDLSPAKKLGCISIHMKWGRGKNCVDTEGIVDYEVSSFKEFEALVNKLEK